LYRLYKESGLRPGLPLPMEIEMRYIAFVVFLCCLIGGCSSEKSGGSGGGKRTALALLAPASSLTVTLPEIPNAGPIPDRFSPNGANETPTVQWSAAPPGTKSFLLLVEDPDAPGSQPFIHYLVYNIPPDATSLGVNITPGAKIGNNSLGKSEYFGPRPPSGVHHYHFQVFALDTTLVDAATATWEALLPQLRGHILAGGEAVATYAKK
jgi:Raf kinase inhibitor-like YbhB/YbcL family protein